MEDLIELGLIKKEDYSKLAGVPITAVSETLPQQKPGGLFRTPGRCVYAGSGKCDMNCIDCKSYTSEVELTADGDLPDIGEITSTPLDEIDTEAITPKGDCEWLGSTEHCDQVCFHCEGFTPKEVA
jgi:hypothetical protein